MQSKKINEINYQGKKYLSLRYAAQVSGYHRDYLGQLIRKKELNGQKIGFAWFIEENEFSLFLKHKEGSFLLHNNIKKISSENTSNIKDEWDQLLLENKLSDQIKPELKFNNIFSGVNLKQLSLIGIFLITVVGLLNPQNPFLAFKNAGIEAKNIILEVSAIGKDIINPTLANLNYLNETAKNTATGSMAFIENTASDVSKQFIALFTELNKALPEFNFPDLTDIVPKIKFDLFFVSLPNISLRQFASLTPAIDMTNIKNFFIDAKKGILNDFSLLNNFLNIIDDSVASIRNGLSYISLATDSAFAELDKTINSFEFPSLSFILPALPDISLDQLASLAPTFDLADAKKFFIDIKNGILDDLSFLNSSVASLLDPLVTAGAGSVFNPNKMIAVENNSSQETAPANQKQTPQNLSLQPQPSQAPAINKNNSVIINNTVSNSAISSIFSRLTLLESALNALPPKNIDQKLQDLSDLILSKVNASLAAIEKRIPAQVQNPVIFSVTQVGSPGSNPVPQAAAGVSAAFGDFYSGISTGGNISAKTITANSSLQVNGDATITGVLNVTSCTGCGGSGSGNVGSGTAGQISYYDSAGSTLTATSSLLIASSQFVGIGTTSPTQLLSIGGSAFIGATSVGGTSGGLGVGQATTTSGAIEASGLILSRTAFANTGTATSTFANGIQLTSGCFLLPSGQCAGTGSSGITSLNGLSGATQTFSANGPLAIVSSGTVHTFNASSSPYFGSIVASSTSRINTLNLDNALTVANGGTGLSLLASGSIFYAKSPSSIGQIASSTDGFILSLSNGIPSWAATTTFNSPLSFSGGSVSCSNCLNSATANGPLAISSSGSAYTFNASSSPYFGSITATSTLNIGAATAINYQIASTSTIPSNTVYAWSLATSTTATPLLTFNTNGPRATTTIPSGVGLSVGGGALSYDSSSGITSADSINTGPSAFDTDAGILSWIDMPSSTTTAGLVNRYSAQIGGTNTLTIYGTTTPGGGILYGSVGVGSTTPSAKLAVTGGSSGTGRLFVLGDVANNERLTVLDNGSVGLGSTTPAQTLSVGGSAFIGATSAGGTSGGLGVGQATTTSGAIEASGLILTRTAFANTGAATSTFTQNGINLLGGCFAVGGNCLMASLNGLNAPTQTFAVNGPLAIVSSGTVHTFNASSSPYFGSITATSTLNIGAATAINYQIASTSTIPSNTVYAWSLATSTTATPLLTFNTNGPRATTTIPSGVGLSVGGGALSYDSSSGITSADSINTGPSAFDTDAGILSWIDMPSSTTTAGLINSYSAQIGGASVLTVYGTTTPGGGILYGSIGIGSTTPSAKLAVTGGSSGTGRLFVLGDVANNERLTVLDNGSVGFGSTTPSSLFTLIAGGGAYIGAASGTTTLDTPVINMPNLATTTVLDNKNNVWSIATSTTARPLISIGSLNGARIGIGTTSPQGPTFAIQGSCVDTGTGCADFAEIYPSSEAVEAADIVAVDTTRNKTIKKAVSGDVVIGIVSSNPAIVIEDSSLAFISGSTYTVNPTNPAIALAGRVPVKISLENGPIKIGDRISASSQAGVGKKAVASDATIGIALENLDSCGGSWCKVLVFVNLGYNKLDDATSKFAQGVADSSLPAPNLPFGIDIQSGKTDIHLLGDLYLQGHTVYDVSKITSFTQKWSIDENGKIIANEIQTNKLEVGSKDIPSGITLFDKITKDPYCVEIYNGELIKTLGSCGSASAVPIPTTIPSPTPTPTATPTPMATTASTTENIIATSTPQEVSGNTTIATNISTTTATTTLNN